MSFELKRNESVQVGVRRVAKMQLANAVAEIDNLELDRHEVVHRVRKRCKQLRGLIRFVRPAMGKIYAQENEAFRDAARPLSCIRDCTSMIGTFDVLMEHFTTQVNPPAFASIRQTLTQRLHSIDEAEVAECLENFRAAMMAATARVDQWRLSPKGFDAIQGGIQLTHSRARKCVARTLANPNTESLHDLRKRVKYHWYQTKLLRPIWPEMLKPYATQLDQLGEKLGDDHNLAVLHETIERAPNDFGSATDVEAFLEFLTVRREELSDKSLHAARLLFAERTKSFLRRLCAYWKIWR